MMLNTNTLLGAAVLVASAGPLRAAPSSAIYEPKPGSAERRAIFSALRVPVGKQVRRRVIFQGPLKASRSGWAFFSGVVRLDDGKGVGRSISTQGSGGSLVALLRKSSGKSSGRWRVMSWGFGGGTDAMDEAMRKHPQAPRALFR